MDEKPVSLIMPQPLKIIWLKTGPLHPLDTGGKIRTYNMLRELKKNHEITYLSLCSNEITPAIKEAASEYSQHQIWIPWEETPKFSARFYFELARNFFSQLPYVIAKYASPEMAQTIRKLDGKFDLIICDFLTPSINLFLCNCKLASKTLLFQHNVEAQIWKRTFKNARGLKRLYFRQQWRRMFAYEKKICARFDAVVGVSPDDCRVMHADYALSNLLGDAPTGVDLTYFSQTKSVRKPQSLVFLGSMDWMPNIDGVVYFAEEIFPLIRAQFPKVTLSIVGRNPVERVKQLASISGIRVTGSVDDVRPYLAKAEVMIVPLRVGGGTRIKIYEGMASGIPVVSTRIGAEGLPVTHGENIFLANAAVDFTQAVCELLNEPAKRENVGKNGRIFVQQNFSWGTATKVFEKFCLAAVRK